MKSSDLNQTFWNERYLEGDTGWDLGYVSPPLNAYFDQLERKDLKILIPGAGNAYEAEHLYKNGFKETYIVDWSEKALQNVKNRIPGIPDSQLIKEDFFKHHSRYDLIVEQTFFCAIHPSLRLEYCLKISELLKDGGKLVGLLFCVPLNEEHPPYGGSKEEYENLFSSNFKIHTMDEAYNSDPARQGKELFINLIKK